MAAVGFALLVCATLHKDKAKKRQISVHCTGPVYATKMVSGEGDRFIIVLSVSNVHVNCLALYLCSIVSMVPDL